MTRPTIPDSSAETSVDLVATRAPIRLTLDALIVLDTIEKAGTFGRAAELLCRVPSAVSYTVHKLEQDLGVLLFDRRGHRAELTQAGNQLVHDARELLRNAAEVERNVRLAAAGCDSELVITIGDVVAEQAVFSLLGAFYNVTTHQSIHLQITKASPATCWDMLTAGAADLAIGALELEPLPEEFAVQPLGRVGLALAMAPTHPLAKVRRPLMRGELTGFRIVERPAWPRNPNTHLGAQRIIVGDLHSKLDVIRHGLAIGYVPEHLIRDDVRAGRLVTRPVPQAPTFQLVVAWNVRRCRLGVAWFLEQLRNPALRARVAPNAL